MVRVHPVDRTETATCFLGSLAALRCLRDTKEVHVVISLCTSEMQKSRGQPEEGWAAFLTGMSLEHVTIDLHDPRTKWPGEDYFCEEMGNCYFAAWQNMCIKISRSLLGRGDNLSTGLLFHCFGGINRSSAALAAWLIFKHAMDADDAIDVLLKARPTLNPWDKRPHILWALKTWEKRNDANVEEIKVFSVHVTKVDGRFHDSLRSDPETSFAAMCKETLRKHEHGSDVLEAIRVPRRPEHCRGRSHCDPQAPGDPVEKRNTSGGSAHWWQKRQGQPETRPLRKLEAHVAATQSLSEVLYVEAWGENGDNDKLAQKCQVGGLVIVQKLHEDPWQGIPAVHPLVPLSALDRVRDRQQICVAVTIVENPGSVERQTKDGAALVCNAIVQQGTTRVRCSFWHEQAEELAAQPAGTSLMLYQVLITKRKDERSWEIGSWRGTSLVACSAEMATAMQAELAHQDNCRMLTEIPVKDWIGCPATVTSLSALVGAIVPGQLRKLEIVFEVVGLQVLGISSVKTETDVLTLADCNCQCTVVLYHELVLRAAASMGCTLSDTVHDTPAVRLQLRDLFRGAQWLCRFTFRENEYQQTLELECRHLQPCWRASGASAVVEPGALQRKVPHCQLNTGCPVAPLNMLQVDVQLGLICIGDVEASFVRALVAFNDVPLPDDETLQQDNTAISAMRVKRSVDCLLSGAAEASVMHRAKLRGAGPASLRTWWSWPTRKNKASGVCSGTSQLMHTM
ncbi:unnamed protein product [Cladocopium goreaui]|uniref:Tyrosine specific protein phosphatases domain-containing protein n=1 Tax=Cladocopium goreaui TaxID=2562237 RepID=A0A9P1BM64_9DINO|nr:unnamed protein product [Cladocopium goreaui]